MTTTPPPPPEQDAPATREQVDEIAATAEPLARQADARLRLGWLIKDS